jgi:hypothetical protein
MLLEKADNAVCISVLPQLAVDAAASCRDKSGVTLKMQQMITNNKR